MEIVLSTQQMKKRWFENIYEKSWLTESLWHLKQLAPSICPALQLSMLQALPKSGTAKNTGLPLPAITSEGCGICPGVADH